jgi:hypothetical protein
MRIISKHRDYYDGARGYGIDPKLVYVRQIKEYANNFQHRLPPEILNNVRLGHGQGPPWARWHDESRNWAGTRNQNETGWVTIGFCGKLYSVIEYDGCYYHSPEELLTKLLKTKTGYADSGRKYTIAPRISVETAKRLRGQKFRGDNLHFPFNTEGWEKWCERYQGESIGDDSFITLGAPVYAYESLGRRGDSKLVVNPPLKGYKFQKFVDSWTAFQELSMYIGNNLAQERQGPNQISDEDMAAMKGFGHKYAFRKEPTTKRR